MAEDKVYINQIWRLVLETEADLTGANEFLIRYKNPDGDIDEFTASCDDESIGDIYYDIQTGEANIKGFWRFWTKVNFSGGSVWGQPTEIEIFAEGE